MDSSSEDIDTALRVTGDSNAGDFHLHETQGMDQGRRHEAGSIIMPDSSESGFSIRIGR